MAYDSNRLYNYVGKATFGGDILGFVASGYTLAFNREEFFLQAPEFSLPEKVFVREEYPIAAFVQLQIDANLFTAVFGATPGSFKRGDEITSRAKELKIEPLYGDGQTLILKKAIGTISAPITIERDEIVTVPLMFRPLNEGAYDNPDWTFTPGAAGGVGTSTRWIEYEKLRSYIMAHYTRSCYISNTLDESFVPGMGVPAIIIEERGVNSNFDDVRILDISLVLSIYEYAPRDPHGYYTSKLLSKIATNLTSAFRDIRNEIPTISMNGYVEGTSVPMLVSGDKKLLKSQVRLRIFVSEA